MNSKILYTLLSRWAQKKCNLEVNSFVLRDEAGQPMTLTGPHIKIVTYYLSGMLPNQFSTSCQPFP